MYIGWNYRIIMGLSVNKSGLAAVIAEAVH